jgi:uncharacterized protein
VALAYKSPGVYREDVYIRPIDALPTGIPGFVGFGRMIDGGPVALSRAEDLTKGVAPDADSWLPDAVTGFFANGGVRCYVVGAASRDENGLTAAIDRLGPLTDLDLVAVPDAFSLAADAAQRVQAAAIGHCSEHGNRFAILDAPRVDTADASHPVAPTLRAWRSAITAAGQPADAALYYPWVKVASPGVAGGRAVPPCGHVAGIFARSDARVGVFKAPANEELIGALDLEFQVDAAVQDSLNPEGINCLRAFPGRGLRVWGARTLSADAAWLYVNTRRLVLTLARWIDANMAWAAFEPNTPRLWIRIQRELNVYLGQLFQAGAFKGASAADAFFVKCDAETNPADAREQGLVTTQIGLAPAAPAEFVIVRIVHRPGAAQLS